MPDRFNSPTSTYVNSRLNKITAGVRRHVLRSNFILTSMTLAVQYNCALCRQHQYFDHMNEIATIVFESTLPTVNNWIKRNQLECNLRKQKLSYSAKNIWLNSLSSVFNTMSSIQERKLMTALDSKTGYKKRETLLKRSQTLLYYKTHL